MSTRKNITGIIILLLVFLWIYTGISKLLDFGTFKLQLSKSPFITGYAGIISWALPVSELLVALLFFKAGTQLIAFYCSLFLMTAFTGYVYAMLHYSYYLPCSCGGVLARLSWVQHLWFNGSLVVLCLVGIWLCLTNGKAVNTRKLVIV